MADSRMRGKPVGRRQIQKKARTELDSILEGVPCHNDDWLIEECCEPGDGAAFSSGTNPEKSPEQPLLEPDTANVDVKCSSDENDADTRGAVGFSPPSSPFGGIVAKTTRMVDVVSDYETSESSSDEVCDINLSEKLQEWYVNSKANLTQLSMLLDTLRPFHPDLPKDARTVAKTPVFTKLKSLENGTYVQIGLEKGIISRLKYGTKLGVRRLGLDVNFDGLPLSNSSNVEAWPVLVRCKDLLLDEPFTVGLYCGSSKPTPVEAYLEDYVTEMQKLSECGISYEGLQYEVFVNSYICDAPARAFIKCIKGHTGYSSCERCIQEGEHDGRRMCFDVQRSAPRTEESFLRQDDEDHHTGVSPLVVLDTKFIRMFVLGPLHLVLHGVEKRFLQHLNGHFPNRNRLSSAQLTEISVKILLLAPFRPSEFARKPRPISMLAKWKATELRMFLLYTGIIVLKDVLREELYKLFLLLHVGCRILSSPVFVKMPEWIDFADQLFSAFVECCADVSVFGPSFVSYNVHGILHLCEDVRLYRTLTEFSTFPFENHLGLIKRLVRMGVNIPQQIARRLAERDQVHHVPVVKSETLTPTGYNPTSGKYNCLSSANFELKPNSKRDLFFDG